MDKLSFTSYYKSISELLQIVKQLIKAILLFRALHADNEKVKYFTLNL